MLITVGLLLGGLVLLVVGGELLVRGASGLALLGRVPPAVVGLTIVAAGTSAPELVVSLSSAWKGSADLSVGNVVGSNIYNVALILGLAAAVRPLAVRSEAVRREWPVMTLASFALLGLAWDGGVGRIEGAALLLSVVAFTVWQVRLARKVVSEEERERLGEVPQAEGDSWGRAGGAAAGGLLLLLAGAEMFVRGAVDVAAMAGLSERVIGLTVVSIGTSLPELFASLMASIRGQTDIALANVIGSNIFNILFILGSTSLILPLTVDPALVKRDMPVMVGFALLLLPFMVTGKRLARSEGVTLMALGAGYTAWLLAG